MLKTFKYRIYPNASQEQKLLRCLNSCRFLYNNALEHRRYIYKQFKKSVSCYDQINSLSEVKELFPEYKDIHSQILQDTLRRLNKAFDSFFRRIERGETPGFPRFQNKERYNSFTYPQVGFKIDEDKSRLFLSKIGHIKIVLHREIEGKIKTLTIRKSTTNKWYACFVVKIDKNKLHKTDKYVGVDLGIKEFITTSDNEKVENIKVLNKHLNKLAKTNRKFSKVIDKDKSIKYKRNLLRVYEKVKNTRDDWQHKVANKLIKENDIIVVEDLNIKELTNKKREDKNNNKSMRRNINDVAWGSFVNKLLYKAEYAGKKVIQVDPKNTSKTCSHCGNIKTDLKLSDRIYRCGPCGKEIDRDYNAAINILIRGMQQHSSGRVGTYSPALQAKGQKAKALCFSLS